MVKGISKQVIVVHSQDRKLFDQAIFILSDDATKNEGVTDDMLLREANKLIRHPYSREKENVLLPRVLFAALGALLTGAVWVITAIL